MLAKPSADSEKGAAGRPAQGAGDDKVVTTIRVSRDTLEILRDAALARDIADVAEASRKGRRPKKPVRKHTVASVIEDLIERHRTELETEAMQIRGRRKGH